MLPKLRAGARALGRQLVARAIPGHPQPRKRIAVVGLPRSGTSWLAKALSLAPGVAYYFEPDVVLDEAQMYRYLPPGAQAPELELALEQQFQGRVIDEYVIAEQGLPELLSRSRRETVLVKWVRFGLMLDWIAEQVPDLAVIQIIRHPVPQFLSWQERAWDPGFNLDLLLGQTVLMEGPLAPYADDMRHAASYWERAAAFWGAMVKIQYGSHRSGWHFMEHEWLCLEPVTRVRALTETLGLGFTDAIEEFLSPRRQRTSGPGYGAARNPKQEVYKWQGRVTSQELAEIAAVLKVFELPFYPELAPDRFEAAGTDSSKS